MDLAGKVALITGGARIGQAVAAAFARRGCHLGLVWRSSKKAAEDAAQRAREQGVRAVAIRADVSKEADCARAITDVVHSLDRLDILIAMASLYHPAPLVRLGRRDDRSWQDNLDVNLRSAYLLSLAAAPPMKRRGEGRILLISDWTAASGRPRYRGYLPYYVSKAGVLGLVQSLALELAPHVTVNAVAPGPILKPPGLSAAADAEVRKNTPLGRWGGAEEIAKAAVFFVESDFVTGECLRVDGGRHLY